ncbi:hypothetical protein LTR10_019082 [Elasticomyces elasticus]|uniref:Major facilitator superfamily (MFS) profile domain-containing protein n=1 Tax=Exophiala sideris TaxID=1016849 RepID=A0ABR0IZB8_9EURO|nr:hypothetical protein LTR10_019082 [Elasticomyces elasticus]KAK5022967.1 hypothetical protein LTS07_009695 [Exophiala sideris]KAK5026354.1 hypothetical protein LTR13_009968 [Exophiala sideris]KAK5052288.1 hypothetical protein LTR69_009824 [Exophiala sideris]KAK5177316.1 hypothetical protein LTR44_010111 [Eurotiomycetes sp. CCFEE 6388]
MDQVSPIHSQMPAPGKEDPALALEEIEQGAYTYNNISKDSAHWLQLTRDAKQATADEHSMTAWEGLRAYKKAVFWSFCFSLTIIMDGYDTAFLGSLYAQPAFQRDFGKPYGDGSKYQVTAGWQTMLNILGFVATLIGVFLDGYLSDIFGRKKVALGALLVVNGTIFCQFFAGSLPVLLVGRMLSSVPFGIFAASVNTYAAEVCPVVLRGYLTTYVCLCWILGQFVSSGVTYSVANITSHWAYRIPFAVQWAWPLPIFCVLLFCPESPWWLVRKGRYEEAERTVKRLCSGRHADRAKQTVAMMIHTNQLEKEVDVGASYLDCFRGVDLRRTEIACIAYGIQALIGSPLQGYTTYFFVQAGLPTSEAFKLNIGNNALSVIGTMLAWPLLSYVGRRSIFMYGLLCMTILYFVIGFVSLSKSDGAAWTQSVLLMVYLFVYSPSVAATLYTIVGEMGSTRLRGKTVALARATAYLVDIAIYPIPAYALNPTAWNWEGKTAFFFGGLCIPCLVWVFFRLPETGKRTFEELDILFERRVPARKFASTKIDAYHAYDEFVQELRVKETH